MREFYRLTTVSFNDSKFAYCEPIGAKYDRSRTPRCPKCGAAIGSMYWIEPRKVILSKPKYGDFIFGNEYLVSERFKETYEKSGLKGINQFIPVEVAKVRYSKKNPSQPPQYYTIDLEYSYAIVDLTKSVVKGQPDERYCSLCMPFGTTIDEINGIYIDDTNWGGEDIFHLHEMGSSIYGSQKFVDFCLKNEFTNFNYENTKDYIFKFGPYR